MSQNTVLNNIYIAKYNIDDLKPSDIEETVDILLFQNYM